MKLSELLELRAMRGPHGRPDDVLAAARTASANHSRHPMYNVKAATADGELDAYPTAAVPLRSIKRFAVILIAGMVACIAVISAALSLRDATTIAPAVETEAPFKFSTPIVMLTAASVEVVSNGQTYKPTGEIEVRGDPGHSQYTTLEITWHESVGGEQRIYMYFASNGNSWWASEIRTYDNGDWFNPIVTGEFFERPLGVTYAGDLMLPNLRIRGMQLEAFRRPEVCDAAAGPLVLVADYPTITAGPGGFGASLQLLDTQTCTAVPVARYTFDYASDDTSIAIIDPNSRWTDTRPTKTRLELRLVSPGATTIRATAKDGAGNVVGTATMEVVVSSR